MAEEQEQNKNEGTEIRSLDDVFSTTPIQEQQPKADVVEDKPNEVAEVENEVEKEIEKEVEVQKPQIGDDDILAYLKSKGKEVNSLEDLWKQPEAKEVNPYEDLLDDDDKAYFEFKKSTGGNRKDFEETKIDYDKIDRKQVLRNILRESIGGDANDSDLDELILEKYEIQMDKPISEMSYKERLELSQLTSDWIANKKNRQSELLSKIKQPEKQEPKQEQQEIVTLEDGTTMPKAKYDKLVENRNRYLQDNQTSVNRVAETSIKISLDDNGNKKELEYSYKFDKDDRHRMLSNTNDVIAYFNKKYVTENGHDLDSLNEDYAWQDRELRTKMLNSFAQSIRAEAIEEVLKENGNVNLASQKGLPKQETKGVTYKSLDEVFNQN